MFFNAINYGNFVLTFVDNLKKRPVMCHLNQRCLCMGKSIYVLVYRYKVKAWHLGIGVYVKGRSVAYRYWCIGMGKAYRYWCIGIR